MNKKKKNRWAEPLLLVLSALFLILTLIFFCYSLAGGQSLNDAGVVEHWTFNWTFLWMAVASFAISVIINSIVMIRRGSEKKKAKAELEKKLKK